MTETLALPSLIPGELHQDGILLPRGLTFDAWESALRNAEWIERAAPWWVVDLVAYGREAFGEEYSQALPDAIEDADGFHQAKLKQAEWMAGRWPLGTRVPGQSYTAHRAVAKLDRSDAVALLNETDRDGRRLTTRVLARRADEVERSVQGRAVTIDGEPIEAGDLGWYPSKADLVDECRARLEVHLSEMSARLRTGFEAGWIRGHVEANALGCFAREEAAS